MIDFNFIKKLEGFELKGYVPNPDTSKSGVSIASGFDIGQREQREIEQAFDRSLSDKLKIYCGKTKQPAADFLADNPLTVSNDEANIINEYAHKSSVSRLEKEWNSHCDTKFDELSQACQTVVASVAFQYGNLRTKTPNFWSQVTRLDWSAAIGNLENFGDAYSRRRKVEAQYLKDNM